MAAVHEDSVARVSDYLDDKLQTSADLSTVDALLIDVRSRYSLLKSQVGKAYCNASLASTYPPS